MPPRSVHDAPIPRRVRVLVLAAARVCASPCGCFPPVLLLPTQHSTPPLFPPPPVSIPRNSSKIGRENATEVAAAAQLLSQKMSDSEEDVKKVVEGEEEEEDTSLANSDVTTKYQEAAKIANAVLEAVLAKVEPGVTPIDLCKAGDDLITEKVAKIFSKKVKGQVVEKGVAFPTCISVNECVANNSPLNSEPQEPLKEGDVVKVDLGVHIDGFLAVVGHTVVAGTCFPLMCVCVLCTHARAPLAHSFPHAPTPFLPCFLLHRSHAHGRGAPQGPDGGLAHGGHHGLGGGGQADQARQHQPAGDGRHGQGGRGLRGERRAGHPHAPAEAVRCLSEEGRECPPPVICTFCMRACPFPPTFSLNHCYRPRSPHRYIVDGNKVIIMREEVDQKVDDVTFEQGEVYSVDVAFSTGEGTVVWWWW